MRKTLIAVILMIAMITFSFAIAEETVWVCPKCGNEATENFCYNCGTANPSEEWICPNCLNQSTGVICSKCGNPKPVGSLAREGTGVSSSYASAIFDPSKFSYDELKKIREQVNSVIEEMDRQYAIEHGDRKIVFSEGEKLIFVRENFKEEPEIIRVLDEAPDSTALLWSSSDDSIATVNYYGSVTGVSNGFAVITATAKDNELVFGSFVVHVIDHVTSIVPGEPTINLLLNSNPEDAEKILSASVEPESAYYQGLTWQSSDESIVSVDDNGHAVGHKPGTAVITIASSEPAASPYQLKKATVKVNVVQAVTGLKLEQKALTISKGNREKLLANVTPETATNKVLKFSSDDETVATVGADGIINARGVGACTITCESTDGSEMRATCRVTVIQGVTRISLPAQSIRIDGISTPVSDNGISTIAYLEVKVLPEDATNKAYSVTSSNDNVCFVQSPVNGPYVPILVFGAGDCVLTFKSEDGTNVTANLRVHASSVLAEEKEYKVTEKKGYSVPVIFNGYTVYLQNNSEALFDANWLDHKVFINPKKAGRGSITLYTEDGPRDRITISIIIDNSAVYSKSEYPQGYYSNILRRPDSYTHDKMHIYGKVLQKQTSGKKVVLRVGTSGYGLYDDVFYVTYDESVVNTKVIEDDKITIYGVCTGTTTYTSVWGQSITIPSINAEKIVFGKVQ